MDADLKIVKPSPRPIIEIDRARVELEQANAQLAAALRAVPESSKPHASAGATDALRRSQSKCDELTIANAQLQAMVDDLRGRVEYLETALASTEQSLSWRITAPMRSVKSAVKR